LAAAIGDGAITPIIVDLPALGRAGAGAGAAGAVAIAVCANAFRPVPLGEAPEGAATAEAAPGIATPIMVAAAVADLGAACALAGPPPIGAALPGPAIPSAFRSGGAIPMTVAFGIFAAGAAGNGSPRRCPHSLQKRAPVGSGEPH
jgi:hypothetical protein